MAHIDCGIFSAFKIEHGGYFTDMGNFEDKLSGFLEEKLEELNGCVKVINGIKFYIDINEMEVEEAMPGEINVSFEICAYSENFARAYPEEAIFKQKIRQPIEQYFEIIYNHLTDIIANSDFDLLPNTTIIVYKDTFYVPFGTNDKVIKSKVIQYPHSVDDWIDEAFDLLIKD